MDNKSTTKRMIGAVVLVLIAALLLAWLLKGKNKSVQEQQELIAEQTQDAKPILGFPGVQKEGEEAGADGQQVAQTGDGSGTAADGTAEQGQSGDAPYVIGAADQQQGEGGTGAAQQVQDAAATGQQQVADAAKATGDAAAGTADAGKEAVQNLANKMGENNATGFQVRDSGGENQQASAEGATEQRPIVENGEVKAGTGSMGATEVAAGGDNTQQQATDGGSGDGTQQVAATGGDAGAADAGSGSTDAAQQQPKVAAADSGSGSGSGASSCSGSAEQKKAANPTLVKETPVPSPRSQTASRSGSADKKKDSGSSQQASASSSRSGSSAGAASGSATGAQGYAIQVLAASSKNKAEQVRKAIAVDGYPTFVVKANVNGKTVYRVRVGTYPARGAAQAVQTRMKARYTKNQYVQNSFVTKN